MKRRSGQLRMGRLHSSRLMQVLITACIALALPAAAAAQGGPGGGKGGGPPGSGGGGGGGGGGGQMCPDVWDPVCGVDGNTYSNECYAAVAGVEVAHHGPCEGGPGGPVTIFGPGGGGQMCPDVWDPVCGVDGNTYSNECYAAVAGVEVAHHGPCAGGPGGPVSIGGFGTCPDLTGDGRVGIDDLLLVINAMGVCGDCREDLTGNGEVGADDLLVILAAWGECGY